MYIYTRVSFTHETVHAIRSTVKKDSYKISPCYHTDPERSSRI